MLAALADLLNQWPVDPDELGHAAHEFSWYRWDAFEPELGWSLRLAVEDRHEHVAWAINAADEA